MAKRIISSNRTPDLCDIMAGCDPEPSSLDHIRGYGIGPGPAAILSGSLHRTVCVDESLVKSRYVSQGEDDERY